MRRYFFPVFVFFLMAVMPLLAQATEVDVEARLALSRELHNVKPVSPQIDRAIERLAAKIRVPEEQRNFSISMKRALNYKAIEEKSIQAMAKIFTDKELEAMIEYYKKPEVQSASEKLIQYQEILQPEITKMLDRAMMEQRTGRAAD